MQSPTASQISATSRLFSSGVFRELATKGRSPLFTRLFQLSAMTDRSAINATVADAFDSAFNFLKIAGHRDAYVYRAALTHRLLLGRHSLNTACTLSEFRAGDCRVDLAILNGTSTAYGIKSERDSLCRLSEQVSNYQRVFAEVYVIASENHLRGVFELVPDDVGVMVLSPRYRISTIRKAADRRDRICPTTLFESLRTNEAESILTSLDIALPSVPNTLRHAAMRALFSQLDPTELHDTMVATLKRTRDLAPIRSFVNSLPRSLHATALSVRLRRANHARLLNALTTPLGAAMKWS